MAVMEAEQVVNLRALRNEAAWLPRSLDDIALVEQALTDAGLPGQVVYGIVGWLTGKVMGRRDLTNERTRARYRKILAELESPLSSGETFWGSSTVTFLTVAA